MEWKVRVDMWKVSISVGNSLTRNLSISKSNCMIGQSAHCVVKGQSVDAY